jgi:uncharacterized membrane protein YhhN
MNPKHRFFLAGLAAIAFCIGFATSLDWRAMLLLKLVPVLVALDWLRVAALPGRYRFWIAIGLGLSLLGDALLALPTDQFIAGLVAFLLAHLAYVAGYLTRSRVVAMAWLIVAACAVAGFLYVIDRHGNLGPMRVPVFVYATVIGAMLWRAGSLIRLDAAGRWALVGASLFVASDMVLAWNRFVAPDPTLRYVNILLYWAGQWGIAASVVRLRASAVTRL